jgi:hypothetical protein
MLRAIGALAGFLATLAFGTIASAQETARETGGTSAELRQPALHPVEARSGRGPG